MKVIRMTKTVYKLRPSDYWRIGEHESWFQDLAAKGFHLKKMGIYFAKFHKAKPKQMKYRIEVSKNKRVKPEQVQMYEESGWDHVTSDLRKKLDSVDERQYRLEQPVYVQLESVRTPAI